MLLEDQHPLNKQLTASVLGLPNAGKSTLINQFLGYDLSIVSQKPQTTRNNFHCAFTIDHSEIVLVDTPGVHSSGNELNIRMNGQAQFAADGVDLNLLVLDATKDPIKDTKSFLKSFEKELTRTWVLFNKSDQSKYGEDDIFSLFEEIKLLIPNAEKYFFLSGQEGDNLHVLTGALQDASIPGPHFYPDGSVSNKNERFFATEYIREQAFNLLKDEVPYELAVIIEEFYGPQKIENKRQDTKISASILVNRQSQRAIVIGSKGSNIKLIGTEARKKIEGMMGGKVHLNLHVKVSPKWFKNNFVLDEIGLPRTPKSHRVWRQK